MGAAGAVSAKRNDSFCHCAFYCSAGSLRSDHAYWQIGRSISCMEGGDRYCDDNNCSLIRVFPVFLQKEEQTDWSVYRLGNETSQVEVQILSFHVAVHRIHSRSYCAVPLPTSSISQHLRAFSFRKRHLPQTDLQRCAVYPQYRWVYLGIAVSQGCMYAINNADNFILSGLATEWYCDQAPSLCTTFSRLLRFHFGSVVGGSFLNAFFNLIDFFLESLRCYPDGTCPACAPFCTSVFASCANLFDLVRTDVYSYSNLTGVDYCNSARYC